MDDFLFLFMFYKKLALGTRGSLKFLTQWGSVLTAGSCNLLYSAFLYSTHAVCYTYVYIISYYLCFFQASRFRTSVFYSFTPTFAQISHCRSMCWFVTSVKCIGKPTFTIPRGTFHFNVSPQEEETKTRWISPWMCQTVRNLCSSWACRTSTAPSMG